MVSTIRVSRATVEVLNSKFPDNKHSHTIARLAGQFNHANRRKGSVLNRRKNTTVTVPDDCRMVIGKMKRELFCNPQEHALGDVIDVLVRAEQ